MFLEKNNSNPTQVHIKWKSSGATNRLLSQAQIDAESLSTSICDTTEKLGVHLMMCIAQCYDNASVMSGEFNGAQVKFSEKVPHAVYVHCNDYRLNLFLTDCLKNMRELSEFFSVVQRLCAFVSCSNARRELFVESQRISG